MKRKLKNMYSEILLDTIINVKWDIASRKEYGMLVASIIYYFESRNVNVGKFSYRFEFETNGLFYKKVKVLVTNGFGYNSSKTDEIRYSIFSPMYWRLRQMNVDRKNSKKIAETNLYMDTYKEFKKSVVERDIKQLEQSLENLSKIEAEQRKQLEELKGEK